MRLAAVLACLAWLPATAFAAAPDDPQPTSSKAPGGSSGAMTTPATKPPDTPPAEPTAEDPDAPQPMSSKAPTSASEFEPAEPSEEPEESSSEPVTLQSERNKSDLRSDRRKWKGADQSFRRHGAGVRGGITVVPAWVLKRWFATSTNALCRGDTIGNFASQRGVVQQDGCNFYVGGEYIYRFNRILDLASSVGYQRVALPPGLWLQKKDYDPADPASLGAADYTEVDLGFVFVELDAIARVPIVVNENVEFAIGGGGGLGLGILLGHIHQTALGTPPAGFANGAETPGSCQTLADFSDHTRCTPRYDINEDPGQSRPSPNDLSQPNPQLYATCTKKECNTSDLNAFGYRFTQGGVPPVIPVINLLLNARVIIKDTVGIGITGGFQTGFYFGGNMQVFFGKPKQDDVGAGPASARRRFQFRRGKV